MRVFEPLTKAELYERVNRFHKDPNRLLTIPLFCELSGIGKTTYRDVFLTRKVPMSQDVQRKVSRAMRLLEKGEIAAKHVGYSPHPNTLVFRKKPVYRAGRAILLQYSKDEGFTLKPQIVNKNSYNVPNLDLTDLE